MTTSAAVGNNCLAIVLVGWFDSSLTLSSVTGASLTWNIDIQAATTIGKDQLAIVTAFAPSGIASSTTITANYSGSVAGDRMICGISAANIASSGYGDGTSSNQPTPPNWSTTGITTTFADDFIVSVAMVDSLSGTSTTTGPAVEAQDFHGVLNNTYSVSYLLASSVGSQSIAGTFSGSGTRELALSAAYMGIATPFVAVPAEYPVRHFGPF